jgi:hypothetical protein
MPTADRRHRTDLALRVAGVAVLVVLAAAGWLRLTQRPATTPSPTFPQAAFDYFAGMDDAAALTPAQIRGRDTWLMWTAGNAAFWDTRARRSFGAFDLLKVLDSRGRGTRFATYGLISEPGFKPAQAPDRFGLWLDTPDGTTDAAYAADYREAFPNADFLRAYGRASGIVGLRLFANPDFDDAARRRWDAERFYDDPRYYRDPALVRPYRVGMACGFCHVAPDPLHPPDDPEHPTWRNLSSNVGNQYFKPDRVFILPNQQDNFLFQVVHAMPPGTVDTSALATDNINNPRNMNAIYQVGTRLKIGAQERLSGGNLALPGTQATMPVPHVLKDGADSVGILGALARVYVSIGSDAEEWTKHFNLLVGGKTQTPYPVAKAKQNSPYVRATFDRLADLADFFVAVGKPQPLARAPGGAGFLQDDSTTVSRGLEVFARNCAACHVSYNKMPKPPDGVVRDTPAWDAWTQSADFATRMAVAMRTPDFLTDNYLSTDRRYPIAKIGTNACAPLASNALDGHIWDNFSSRTYKDLPSIGTIGVADPLSGEQHPYKMPGGGRGYERAPSLVSIWASAPYLHNNSIGVFTGDPSVAGRIRAYQDAMEKLLWPEKRAGFGSVYRTTQTSWLTIEKSYLPAVLFAALKAKGLGLPGDDTAIRLGPIPKGTPVNLIANLDLEFSLGKLPDFVSLAVKLNAAWRDIRAQHLDETASAARLKEAVPALLALNKCPDFVTDRGHLFGTGLSNADKFALMAYVKRL